MTSVISDIFNDFRSHIVDISDNVSLRERYISCKDEKKRKALFTRNRVWTFRNLVHAILMCFKRTLSSELAEFLEKLNLPQTTPEAYIKRRGFISSDIFKDLNMWLNKRMYDAGALKTWHGGKYLCGIDGSILSLPYTPELYTKYMERDDKGHNMARGIFINDLVNRTLMMADFYVYKTEERKAALQLMSEQTLPYPMQQTVFVMDRGYPSLQMMNWFAKNTGGFIIRACRDTNKQIAEFMDSDKTTAVITISLSRNRRDLSYPMPDPIRVRLVKRPPMQGENETVVLITNLNADEFPDELIVEAYRMRWRSETEIGIEKNQLQIEIFSGVREICIKQDFFAAIILYNLETVIRLFCEHRLEAQGGKYEVQIDVNCTWLLVISLIYAMFSSDRIFDRELTFTIKMCLRMISLVRPGRSSPRNRRVIKYSGKYITMTNYKRGI